MPQDGRQPSGWAVGYTLFAAILLMIAGGFQVISGITALFEDDFFVVAGQDNKWVWSFDVSAWGWVHIVLGVLLALVGYGLLRGNLAARIVAILLAAGSAIAYFMWLPYYPIWAGFVIALNIAVIWALTAHGRDVTME